MSKLVRKLGFLLLYSLYLVAALALIDYLFFYRPYHRELRDHKLRNVDHLDLDTFQRVRHVSEAAMKKLGKVTGSKKSQLFNFPKQKAPAGLRVCAFGDSFTFGEEVDDYHDYPALLQALFERAGARNVEVINFGNGGYGFHQTYLMWELVGRDFGCDYSLLGPRGFQPERDTTFGYILGMSPYYLHARYVLDGQGVRLVEIEGDTYGERFDDHFSFIPKWRYLRYDRKPPMFLRSLIPRDRKLSNPFYYDPRPPADEAYETYRRLLAQMAASGEPILLGAHRAPIAEIGRSVQADNLAATDFDYLLHFPYVATVYHASPFGNQYLAEQFFHLLTGSGPAEITVLETAALDSTALDEDDLGAAPSRALSSYSRVEVQLAETSIGQFVISSPTFRGSPTATHSLLAFKAPETSLVDAAFVPLDFDLEDGMEVTLSVGEGSAATSYPLATVRRIGGLACLGYAELEGLEHPDSSGVFFRGNAELNSERLPSSQGRILVAGRHALDSRSARRGVLQGLWIAPREGESLRFVRARGDALVDLRELPSSGTFELALDHHRDGLRRLAFAAWRKTTRTAPALARPLTKKVVIGADGLASVE